MQGMLSVAVLGAALHADDPAAAALQPERSLRSNTADAEAWLQLDPQERRITQCDRSGYPCNDTEWGTTPGFIGNDLREYVMSFWHPGLPYGASCETLARLGDGGDGGKYVCNPSEALGLAGGNSSEQCVVVAVGSNGEASFESDIHRLNPACEIHVVDGGLTEERRARGVVDLGLGEPKGRARLQGGAGCRVVDRHEDLRVPRFQACDVVDCGARDLQPNHAGRSEDMSTQMGRRSR